MSATTELKSPADVQREIERITKQTVLFGGGGRGQVATVFYGGRTLSSGRAPSRGLALSLLLNTVVDETPVFPIKKPRPTVDDAIARLRSLFGDAFVVVDQDPDDEAQIIAPDWGTLKNPTLKQIVPCVGECMSAHPNAPCECRCEGANHAIGSDHFAVLASKYGVAAAIKQARPVRLEPKPCLCGCEGITMRRFVPGHDARFHAAAKRAAKEAAHTAAQAAVAPEPRVGTEDDPLPF